MDSLVIFCASTLMVSILVLHVCIICCMIAQHEHQMSYDRFRSPGPCVLDSAKGELLWLVRPERLRLMAGQVTS
jgi:hypothetical protein